MTEHEAAIVEGRVAADRDSMVRWLASAFAFGWEAALCGWPRTQLAAKNPDVLEAQREGYDEARRLAVDVSTIAREWAERRCASSRVK